MNKRNSLLQAEDPKHDPEIEELLSRALEADEEEE